MKRIVIALALLAPLTWARGSFAADAAKPDCSAKQKEFDDSKAAPKPAKADLSSCKEKKGSEKADCEKPLKDKTKEEMKAAQDKMKAAKKGLECCKNPKMKGCAP